MDTNDLQSLPEYSKVPFDARVAFLLDFALEQHRGDMDFLLHTAKLRIKHHPDRNTGWNNVMKHNVAQSVAMREIAIAMNLPEDEVSKLERYAFLHNPTICRDIFHKKQTKGVSMPATEAFSAEEVAELDAQFATLIQEVDPSGSLRLATSPEFFDKIASQPGDSIEDKADTMPFSDLLVYYVDALFDDGNLIAAHDRIKKMEQRRPDLNQDQTRTERLGIQYWDAERAVSTRVQQRVWERLRDNGIEPASAADVPEFIRKQVGQTMLRHWESIKAPRQEISKAD